MSDETPLADAFFPLISKDVPPKDGSAQQWKTVARIARALAADSLTNKNAARAEHWQNTAHQAEQRRAAAEAQPANSAQ